MLITGGTSGIGLALVREFLRQDFQVATCGTNSARVANLQSEFPQICCMKSDILQPSDRTNLIARTVQSYGRVDILFNNAGVQHSYDFTRVENVTQDIQKEVDINFTAPVQLIAELLPVLQKSRCAKIVNVTSCLAYGPKTSAPVYCATKAALQNFTLGLRYQLESTSIEVIELIPPLVETAMTQGRGKGKISPEEFAQQAVSKLNRSRETIPVGKARILHGLSKFAPSIVKKILKNS